MWAAITGALAIVPFLGYLAVAALTVRDGISHGACEAVEQPDDQHERMATHELPQRGTPIPALSAAAISTSSA